MTRREGRTLLRDIKEILKALFIKLIQSRLFALCCVFIAAFMVLFFRLYDLQIRQGEQYQEDFISSIERVVTVPGTRGNIYDANGNLLAYNKLSYNVTITDIGAYTGDYNSRNQMLYALSSILEKHSAKVVSSFEISMDDDGEFYYTSASEASKRRFLANVYSSVYGGTVTTEDLDTRDRYSSDISAYDCFKLMVGLYAFDSVKDEEGAPVIITDQQLLDMVKILYALRQSAFRRYESTTIATDIDESCMAEIKENRALLKGVEVEETYIRRYNNAKYFSHIIGYTGAIRDQEQLASLQKTDPSYEITDIVGATGLEASMETALQGGKGETRMYVDSYGNITEIISSTSPEAGDNFYLTIEQNLQIGIYHLLEQQLASILANKIVNMPESELPDVSDSSEILISIDEAYYQLINNNVLDMDAFSDEDAGMAEQAISAAFDAHKAQVLSGVETELSSDTARSLEQLDSEYYSYMVYIYEYLSNTAKLIDTSKIDRQSETYLAWRADTISLRSFLYSGISEGFIDTAGFENESSSKYEDADDLYNQIVSQIMGSISSDEGFDKLIYRNMITNDQISGSLLCMALYEQGILDEDTEQYQLLSLGDESYAYSFFINRIYDIDITPAQLALDPCMGSVVVTDVNTGEVKALVTYPGYDNNRINDTEYFNECLNDQSLPLINSATQTNKAPGSTFKPIAAIAVLEEGKIGPLETVDCTGIYEYTDPEIRCWLGPPGHGDLTVREAIENSCNYCFSAYGHLLSVTEKGATPEEDVTSTQQGLDTLHKYAAMFGLDRKSGIQIDEKEPHISDEDPERSSFGQGTHSYNNVQLARYATALANRGTVFDLTLLRTQTDSEGNILDEFPAAVSGKVEISDSTWDIVQGGVRDVITDGVAARVFSGFDTVQIAGKTGTAEEIQTRGNHAVFISYAPFDAPEIAVTVMIPFGYSSGNAASLASRVYNYYYGGTDLPSIISGDARGIGIYNVSGG